MARVDRSEYSRSVLIPRYRMVVAAATAVALMLSAWAAFSQTVATVPGVAAPSARIEPPAIGTKWTELTHIQQEALQPLAKTWGTLEEARKRKWIAVAQSYPSLSPESKEKLHSRMVEWAALSPRDREQARLNFAETKKLAPADRAADWDAYLSLTPQERQKLADQATKKPTGAAIAVKPVPPDKLATVPVTRLSPPKARLDATERQAVHRNTLLPKAPVAEAEPAAPPPN